MSALASNCLNTIDVLVLAGGLGTRIRPVLGDTPKLLAPIAGLTYLDHLLGWLARFGARQVVLDSDTARKRSVNILRDARSKR